MGLFAKALIFGAGYALKNRLAGATFRRSADTTASSAPSSGSQLRAQPVPHQARTTPTDVATSEAGTTPPPTVGESPPRRTSRKRPSTREPALITSRVRDRR